MNTGDDTSDAAGSLGWKLLDVVLALWCVYVGVVFYGGYLNPAALGFQAGSGIAVYAALVIVSAVVLAIRYLRQTQDPGNAVSGSRNVSSRRASGRGSGETDCDR